MQTSGAGVESFGAYGRPGGVLRRISRTHRREQHGGLGRGIGGGPDKAAVPLGFRSRRILGPGARSECFASVGDWCLE